MNRKAILFLISFFLTANLYAQKKIAGFYDTDTRQFNPTENNILVREFKNGLAAFMIKGKDPFVGKTNRVGFIDTTGKIVIKPIYTNCSEFNGDFALVIDTLYRTAMINRFGKLIIPFAQQRITNCGGGLYILSTYVKTQTISVVDSNNHVIVPFGIYSFFATSSGPLYPVGFMEGDDSGVSQFYWQQAPFNTFTFFDKYLGVKRDSKWAVINRGGKEIIPPKFEWIGIFTNGAAPVTIDKKRGITDTTGQLLIAAIYDNIALIRNNLVIAIKDKKSGVLSITNKLLIPFQYDRISQLPDNVFKVDTGNKCGIVDQYNATIIPLTNQNIEKFGSGYLVKKDYYNAAVFDSRGAQKTPYVAGGNLTYPVWDMGRGNGYTAYNSKKRDFIHYDKMNGMLYYKDGKWGLIDSAGTEITSPVYDECRYTHGNHIAVQQNNKWGIINSQGNLLIPYKYNEIETLGEQILLVKKDGKFGILNSALKFIVPVKYDEIKLTGYVNRYGNTLHNGISVTLNGKYGYFDISGKEIIPAKFDRIMPFQDDVTQVMLNGKWGLYNTSGVQVIPCIYDYFNIGLPALIITQNKLAGLMNHEGKFILPLANQSIKTDILDGKTIFRVTYNGKEGLFDISGQKLFPFIFTGVQKFQSRYSSTVFKVWDGVHYGVSDYSGKVTVPLIYDQITLIDNLPGVSEKYYKVEYYGKQGIVNERGKQVIPPDYSNLNPFLSQSLIANKNGKPGVIDWSGKTIVPFIYDQIYLSQNGYIVQIGRKYGVRGLDGKEVAPLVYDYIDGSAKDVFFVESNNKYGLMDVKGKMLIEPIYDTYSGCSSTTFVVVKDNLKGMVDYKGHVIYPCQYTFINCADGKVVEIY